MRNLNKARLIVFITGIIFTILAIIAGIMSVKTHETLKYTNDCTLPAGVHIPININTADAETICLLDNIGMKTAENIIAYREENGGFKNKEDIKNVKGIADKKYEEIKNYITVE